MSTSINETTSRAGRGVYGTTSFVSNPVDNDEHPPARTTKQASSEHTRSRGATMVSSSTEVTEDIRKEAICLSETKEDYAAKAWRLLEQDLAHDGKMAMALSASAGGEGAAAQHVKQGTVVETSGGPMAAGGGGAGGEGGAYTATREHLLHAKGSGGVACDGTSGAIEPSRERHPAECDLRRREAGAWEQWREQKRREETARRRREERQRRAQEEREEAAKAAEEARRGLEEENRAKWLARKRREQEERRKHAAEQRKEAEKQAVQEAERQETRMRQHLETQRRLNQKRDDVKKEEAQRRAREVQRLEEEQKAREERRAQQAARWSERAANTPRPVTGSIFNRNPVPSVPKVAVSYCNPEPWQF